MELGALFKDVATIIAEKCVNPGTQRPYTVSMIERALRDAHFSVDPKRGAKQQALHVRGPSPWLLPLLSGRRKQDIRAAGAARSRPCTYPSSRRCTRAALHLPGPLALQQGLSRAACSA